MPRYDYKCPKCDNIIEVTELHDYKCDKCDYPMKRVWTPTPVHYIGYGWTTKGERK